jgi:hypothetical protein
MPALILMGWVATACQATAPAGVPEAIAGKAPEANGTPASATSPERPGSASSAPNGAESAPGGAGTASGAPGALPSPSPSPRFGGWAAFSGFHVLVRLPGAGLPYHLTGMANGIDQVEVRIGGRLNSVQTRSPGPTDTELDFPYDGYLETDGYTVSCRALSAAGTVLAASDRVLVLDAAGHASLDAQGRSLTVPGTFALPHAQPLVFQLTLGSLNTKVKL